MSDYLLQEDGASKFTLEDSSGFLEEEFAEVDPSFIASITALYAPSVAYAGQQTVVSAAGSYSWLCPAGVTLAYVECVGGGGGSGEGGLVSSGTGGGGGAYSARIAVPVTPGTFYSFVVGAAGVAVAGSNGTDGSSSTFTGDGAVQVIAVGGGHGIRSSSTGGTGGAAASCTGDTGLKFSGGNGDGGTAGDGGGGGASGNHAANGASASGKTHGAGANGGGSGGDGGTSGIDNAQAGSAPGGGAGGGSVASETGRAGAAGQVTITAFAVPFIASVTVVYPPAIIGDLAVSFIASVTAVYMPAIVGAEAVPFIASVTVVYTPTLAGPEVDVPFIASKTHVWRIFTTFDPNRTYSGPGNGGEAFLVHLNANGVTDTATLASNISDTATALELTSDGSLPSTMPFVVTIDTEIMYVVQLAAGSYRIRARGISNTAAAAHTAGATVSWRDSYDLALVASSDIAHEFTADIASSGSFIYPGWLICFDSSQAYLAGDRYPMHVTEMLGVFDAGAGSTGTNRCDATQPNAIATPTGATSDDCPAALSNPARISSDILTGDVALVRYTNPEATVLDLGPRAVSLQSWFGLKRVDATDGDVTFTDPNGIVVDTTAGAGTFTGSVNDEWGEPIPLLTGIAPDASDAAGTPIDTPNPVAWTTVTLPGTDRKFTYGSGGGGYDEKGWPMCCLAVRQGNRRVPRWQSWDWHDYAYVYTGFGTDATFAQLLINRNGIVNDLAIVDLPGPQDIDGPDAVWDDETYFVGASWYVAIFNSPYLVFGPGIGGTVSIGGTGSDGFVPVVSFPTGPGGTPVIGVPPPPGIEGGSGGDINTGLTAGLFQAAAV